MSTSQISPTQPSILFRRFVYLPNSTSMAIGFPSFAFLNHRRSFSPKLKLVNRHFEMVSSCLHRTFRTAKYFKPIVFMNG
uniref:Uncharacterized protein n=1 Tax=Octopus bimaculoides TaxID=37653 RepID=A0A0L8IDH5_OCTBM